MDTYSTHHSNFLDCKEKLEVQVHVAPMSPLLSFKTSYYFLPDVSYKRPYLTAGKLDIIPTILAQIFMEQLNLSPILTTHGQNVSYPYFRLLHSP